MSNSDTAHKVQSPDTADWHDRLAGTNINPETLLATDYLNHFNEVVMLLELLPSMPECAAEVLTWKPKSYSRHFADSHFAYRQLAIDAYAHAPEAVRSKLEAVVAQMDELLTGTIARLSNDPDEVIAEGPRMAGQLHRLIDLAGSIINGSARHGVLERIEREPASSGEEHFTQDDIDSLFD